MSILDKSTPTQLQNGLNKDLNYQRPGDATFVLNAIRDNHDGGRQEYQSEPGNLLIASIPVDNYYIGSIYGQNDEVYVFYTDNDGSDYIALFKQDKLTTLAALNLGFDIRYPITGEYRVKNGCERIIYWCDKHNPDRYFNIDKPDDFKTTGVFDANKFKFVPDIKSPKINLVSVNDSGGNLPLGSYYFQLEFVDKDLNSLYRTDISPQTVIYNEDQSDSFNNIDGGLNIPQYDPAIGGVPNTNKSITLNFSNLDTSFDYVKVNVIRQIAGTQVVDAHSVSQLIPISSDEINWTYTGYNVSSGDYPVDYSSLVIDDIKYKASYVQEQVQGRLVRANVIQDTEDYSLFQAAASKITAQWVAKEVPINDQFALGNPKNPNTYWDCTTFQGDEIYAFAIQYLFDNGTWSPSFPLIGRHSNASDLDTITVVANSTPSPTSTQVWESDVQHLGLSIGDTLPRWKAFNTASITTSNTITHPYNYVGEFGYYESEAVTYPDIQDCDGNYIWGLDPLNNEIIPGSTNIRHFRFPDRRLIPHLNETGEYIVPLGVKFDDIIYPASNIVGHRFLRATRNEADKTVLDSGWFTKQFDNANLSYAPNPTLNGVGLSPINTSVSAAIGGAMTTGTYGRYNSGDIMFNHKLQNPDHLRFNQCYRFDIAPVASPAIFDETTGGTITIDLAKTVVEDVGLNTRTNYAIESNTFIPEGSTTLSVLPVDVISYDLFSPDSVIKTKYELENLSGILGATVPGKVDLSYTNKKVNRQVYDNLLNLQYNYIHFNFQSSLTSTDNTYYGGDSLIIPCVTTRVLEQASYVFTVISYILYEEKEFNWSLRHGGLGQANKYCKVNGDYKWLLDKIGTLDPDNKYEIRSLSERWPEYYAYNKDYTVQFLGQIRVSLPLNYEYCSSCLNEYPNRIIFSPKSFDEESFDLYRINKVNDYIDLPAHRGQITGLCYQNNQLLVHTEDTTFILQPNPQQISTDQNTAYLTTGDFLSIPPQELVQTDVGAAGLQSKQSQCNTPFGHYWVDQKRGEIFGWDNKLEVISNKGLLQWFKENLPSEATNKFFEIEGLSFPINSSYDLRGVGCIMYYDPRFKRLVITKRDFLPINQREEFVAEQGDWVSVWNFETLEWEGGTAEFDIIPIDPTNKDYFENKSWTISYSFLDQSFTSWHSYIPSFAFSDSNNFYTSNQDNNLFRHLHKERYQNYYNTKYDFIIEWMAYDGSTDVLDTIHYQGYTLTWDVVRKQWVPLDKTFNNLICYNFDQSTGLVSLNFENENSSPYAFNTFTNTAKNVIRTDNNFKISGLYDILVTNPPMSSEWNLVKDYLSYIDQVPVVANHNTLTSAYNLANIKNKFVLCRLFFKPSEDCKKIINLIETNEMRSIR